ncbi:MAG: MATE family efflux transporter [Treponema sp.]|nr:MATE family efflux transporter [Treponema sp.]
MSLERKDKDKKDNILGTEKISRLLVKFAVPGIVSMVVNALYNIIDQIFIGQGVGYLGNGATTVVFPMTSFAMAFSLLFGDGAAAMFSLRLGENKREDAAKSCLAGITGFVIGGLLIAIGYLLFFPRLCHIFGATEAILPYAIEYGTIITCGLPFFAICAGGSSLIRADGNPRYNMIGLFSGTVINLVCDPLFIFVFHWGVKGAALATILGQFVNAMLNVYYFIHKMSNVELTLALWKKSFSFIPKVARLGVSSFITQMSMVVAIAVRNNILVQYGLNSKYGPDIPITTLGITMKVFAIIISIVIGLSAGAQPIFGYNYGSGRYGRVKECFRLVAVLSTAICILAFLIAQLRPMAVISIFGSESELYNEFAVKCMRIFLMLIPTAGVQIMSGIFFQSLGYPVQASILSLSKQILFQIPATIAIPIFIGVEGVLWAGPVSDILALLLTVILLLIYWRRIFERK